MVHSGVLYIFERRQNLAKRRAARGNLPPTGPLFRRACILCGIIDLHSRLGDPLIAPHIIIKFFHKLPD